MMYPAACPGLKLQCAAAVVSCAYALVPAAGCLLHATQRLLGLAGTIGSLTICRLFLHLEVVSAQTGGTGKQLTVVEVALLPFSWRKDCCTNLA